MPIELARGAAKAIAKLHPEDAGRMRELIAKASEDEIPYGATRMAGGYWRKRFGGIPYKLQSGKLRLLYIPGQQILAAGYRKDVYAILPGQYTN